MARPFDVQRGECLRMTLCVIARRSAHVYRPANTQRHTGKARRRNDPIKAQAERCRGPDITKHELAVRALPPSKRRGPNVGRDTTDLIVATADRNLVR